MLLDCLFFKEVEQRRVHAELVTGYTCHVLIKHRDSPTTLEVGMYV